MQRLRIGGCRSGMARLSSRLHAEYSVFCIKKKNSMHSLFILLILLLSGTACSVPLYGMPGEAAPCVAGSSSATPYYIDDIDSLAHDSICADTVALTLREKLDSILSDDMLQTSQIGFVAYDLTADTLLYARNEHQTMRPASTMKLLTAIAALDRLGGSYRYSTMLKADGSVYVGADGDKTSRTLAGRLVVVGGMDPMFGSDDMRAFVESLQREHIDTIYGEVVADMSFKEPALLGEGWCWDDDNPVLTPLPWNRKDNFMQKFRSLLDDAGIAILSPEAFQSQTDTAFTLASDTLADMPQPAFMHIVEKQFSNAVLSTRYHTIDQVLVRMMKRSDNLYAESLFYHLAAAQQRPATAKRAAHQVVRLLQKIGVSHKNYRIADGSGLSLYNYLTPDMLMRMLRYAYRNPNIYEYLYPSLPIAGVDGTLQKRMLTAPCKGNVRGKTGTLTGISSLAGYLTAANGNTVCYVIINQGVMRAATAKAMQDRLCQALCEYKAEAEPAKPNEKGK